jgi:hypothetical protein
MLEYSITSSSGGPEVKVTTSDYVTIIVPASHPHVSEIIRVLTSQKPVDDDVVTSDKVMSLFRHTRGDNRYDREDLARAYADTWNFHHGVGSVGSGRERVFMHPSVERMWRELRDKCEHRVPAGTYQYVFYAPSGYQQARYAATQEDTVTPWQTNNRPQCPSDHPCYGESSGSSPEQQDATITTRVDNTDSGVTPEPKGSTRDDGEPGTDLNAAIRELAQMVAHMIAGTKEGDHVDPQETGTDDEPTHEPSHADTHHERDASSVRQDGVIGRITSRRIPVSEANFTGFSGNRP